MAEIEKLSGEMREPRETLDGILDHNGGNACSATLPKDFVEVLSLSFAPFLPRNPQGKCKASVVLWRCLNAIFLLGGLALGRVRVLWVLWSICGVGCIERG